VPARGAPTSGALTARLPWAHALPDWPSFPTFPWWARPGRPVGHGGPSVAPGSFATPAAPPRFHPASRCAPRSASPLRSLDRLRKCASFKENPRRIEILRCHADDPEIRRIAERRTGRRLLADAVIRPVLRAPDSLPILRANQCQCAERWLRERRFSAPRSQGNCASSAAMACATVSLSRCGVGAAVCSGGVAPGPLVPSVGPAAASANPAQLLGGLIE
jgi:hypothetical protein